MKKFAALTVALMLCLSLACPAFAADFVPSITYKGEPEMVPPVIEDLPEELQPEPDVTIIGVVRDEFETPEEYISSLVEKACLVVTPVAKAEESELIPEHESEVLLEVYRELSSGRMKLPYEGVEGYNGQNMVIRELLDVTWLCGEDNSDHDHPTEVAPEGVVFDVIFDLGVAPDDYITVMTYNDGKWTPIVEVENLGDGTVRCVFEHLCPVAVSVAQGGMAKATDSASTMPWMLVMAAALAAIVGIFVVLGKKEKKA